MITASRTNAPGSSKREPNDFYRTPAYCTRALLGAEPLPHDIWEPACGDGAIANVLAEAGHTVISTDLVDRGHGEAGRDFLMEQTLAAPCIATNPPFQLADEFVIHALRLGASKIAMFMRLAWLEGSARHARLWSRHPPVRIWVFSKRQTLWRGDDPEARTSGGAVAFAWFVWEAGFCGAPAIGWLNDRVSIRTKEQAQIQFAGLPMRVAAE